MIDKITAPFRAGGLKARAMRGTLASVGLTLGGQFLRFGSNLILTRLLFPEAFGLMALVHVIIAGLEMVSTFGLRISVMQNARGDEENFLNTAWTFQIIRGVLLWLVLCAASPVFANFYEQPLLAQILPIAGFALVIQGFHTTNVLSVQRHLQLGRYASLTLITQVINLVCLSLMAWWLGTVWALVIGTLISPVIALILFARYLPGIKNRLYLERDSVREILKLGKYLFFSTIATYVINQSDRGVLGIYIPLSLLGVYGIAFVLAAMPANLATSIAKSVVFPLYRLRHPMDAPEHRGKIFRARRLVAVAALTMTSVLAYLGPWLIDFLYDDRYQQAGPIVVMLCMANVPLIVLNGVMNAALTKGDSRRFMLMNVATAVCQLILIIMAVRIFGVGGAALAIGVAPLLTYPLLVYFQKIYKNWDPKGELGLIAVGFAVTGGAVALHWDRIAPLLIAH